MGGGFIVCLYSSVHSETLCSTQVYPPIATKPLWLTLSTVTPLSLELSKHALYMYSMRRGGFLSGAAVMRWLLSNLFFINSVYIKVNPTDVAQCQCIAWMHNDVCTEIRYHTQVHSSTCGEEYNFKVTKPYCLTYITKYVQILVFST